MKALDKDSLEQIIGLLSPLVSTEQDRRALIFLSFVNHPLTSRIDFSGSAIAFLSQLIETLEQFGKLEDERPALWVLLETSREQVGVDKKRRIDALRASFELPLPPLLDRLFVSYSRENELFARKLVSDLKDAGLRVWYDREKIKVGEDWWQSIDKGIHDANYFVFCLSRHSISSKVAQEELLTARQANKPIFAVMVEECLDTLQSENFAEIQWLQKLHILDFTKIEDYGKRIRELIESLPGYAPPDSYFLEKMDARNLPNPFRGLEVFREVDAAYFAGRTDDVEELLAKLKDEQKPRILAVIGASGSGKSSLVRAGLIPALRQELPFWESLSIIPGTNPLDTLAERLEERLGTKAEGLRERLATDVKALGENAAELMASKPKEARFVLVIDQFEELFTLTSEDERQHFLELLLTAIEEKTGRVQIIITMRADFFGHLGYIPELAKFVRENLYIVSEMSPSQLRRSIEDPAEKAGVNFEEGLIEEILEDMREQPGALPLLQYALKALFERKLGRMMTLDGYRTLGGGKGALGTHAESIYETLEPVQQDALRRVLLRLIEVGDDAVTRRRVILSDLQVKGIPEDVVTHVLNLLTDAKSRLLVVSAPMNAVDMSNDALNYYEVSHEALLTHWTRLANWIGENRDDLRQSSEILALAQAWNKTEQKDNSFLLRGARLANAQAWMMRADKSSLQEEFVNASIGFEKLEEQFEQELQKRALTRARQLAGTLGVSLVIFIILSLVAAFQWFEATQRSLESQSLSLSANARNAYTIHNPDLALALVLEANSMDSPPLEAQQDLMQLASAAGTRLQVHAHQGNVNSVVFAPDNCCFASGGSDGELILWDAQSGEELSRFTPLGAVVTSLVYSPDGNHLAAGSDDGFIHVWNLESHEEVYRLRSQVIEGGVWSLAYSPDSSWLLAGSGSRRMVLWDMSDGSEAREFKAVEFGGHSSTIYDIDFSTDGRQALTASKDNTVILWDVETAQPLKQFTGHTGEVTAVAFTEDGLYAISSSTDRSSILWDLATGEMIRRYLGHEDFIYDMVLGGRYFVTVSADTSMRVWDIEEEFEVARLDGPNVILRSVEISSDYQHIVSGSSDGQVRVWDLENALVGLRFTGHQDAVRAVAYTSDEQSVISVSDDGMFIVWDASTGTEQNRFVLENVGTVTSMAVGSNMMVSSAMFDTVRLWDIRNGQALGTLDAEYVVSVALSPDEARLLTGDTAGNIILWDVATRTMLRQFIGHKTQVISLAFSGDGRFALSGSNDAQMILWDVETGEMIQAFNGHVGTVTSVAFSADDRYLIAGGIDAQVIVWERESGAMKQIFRGHSDEVTAVTGSPNEQTVLSASDDGTVIYWDIETGQEILRLLGHYRGVTGIAISGNQLQAISSSHDRSVIVWQLEPRDWMAWVDSNRYVPVLTCEELALYQIRRGCVPSPVPATPTFSPPLPTASPNHEEPPSGGPPIRPTPNR